MELGSNYRLIFSALTTCYVMFITPLAEAQDEESNSKPIGMLFAVGDVSRQGGLPECGTEQHHLFDEMTVEIVKVAIADSKKRNLPFRIILLGDLAYQNGREEDFYCFDKGWKQFQEYLLPVPGNHEYDLKTKNGKTSISHKKYKKLSKREKKRYSSHAGPYFEYFREFPRIKVGESWVSLVTSEGEKSGYYGLRFPQTTEIPWFLVGLNPYTNSKQSPPWREWLVDKLRINKDRCVLAFAHPFRFSSGYHGHDNSHEVDAKLARGETLKSSYIALQQAGASLLLSGHDHHFEQFGRQDVDGKTDATGLRSFIVGTGGGKFYLSEQKQEYKNIEKNSEAPRILDAVGILQIELYPDKYKWRFIGRQITKTDGKHLPVVTKFREDTCNLRSK